MAKLITGVIGPGSMLPITVGDFEKALSRSRAEVLAAAITLFAKREPHHRAWDEPVRLLRNLQPAAKALEELLREERERPICDCHNWDSAEELHRYLVAVEKQRDQLEAELRDTWNEALNRLRAFAGDLHVKGLHDFGRALDERCEALRR